ncbi:major facilitator superfamily domain-containing protein [Xylariaceae sp. FL0016]|nr:major facilitator superfamily domain-containing protein [Xylariaceae sp. FL0016]
MSERVEKSEESAQTVSESIGTIETSTATEPLDPAEDKRILRRIDTRLLTVLAVSYMFQLLDKSALNYTSILSLRTDLHLTGVEFSWASSIYYVGYLIGSPAASRIIVKFDVGKVLACSIFVWGSIIMLAALCTNGATLIVTRFFLGVAECAIAPILTVVVAMWYKRSEQTLRQGAWYLGTISAGPIGGLIAYGLAHLETFASWKAIFLIFGSMTVCWSAMVLYRVPNTPMNARFLKREDRPKAVQRVQENMTGIKSNEFKKYQCIEALTDAKVWLLVLIQFCGQVANGAHTFGSIIIKGFGFSTLNTLLVGMLGSAFQLVFLATAVIGSTYLRNTRTYWMAWNLAWALIGAIMVRQIDPELIWTRFMGYCLTHAHGANFPMILIMSSTNVGGFTKKTTANAMILISYCVGNILGPQFFFESETPGYPSGYLTVIICYSIGFVACFAIRCYLVGENKRRDLKGEVLDIGNENGILEVDGEGVDVSLNLIDKTDKEIPQFRFLY